MNIKTIQEIRVWMGEFLPDTEEHGYPALEAILNKAEQETRTPHIICLAAAKHYRLRPAMTVKAWIISLVKIGDRNTKFVAKGETYWEAEAKARQYLESERGDK